MRKVLLVFTGLLLVSSATLRAAGAPKPTMDQGANIEALRSRFVNPPKGSGTTTLWWLNGKLSKEQIRQQMLNLRDKDGFGGVAPLPMHSRKPATEPAYLSEAYFEMYGYILETAKELGMTVVFYDDNDFPSGRAGTLMAERYPEDLVKYLARGTTTVDGPDDALIRVPKGTIMSVVAKDLETGERRVVTPEAHRAEDGSSLTWKAPAGRWEVQAFVCATGPRKFLVDYLDPEAVKKFLGLTFDRFYERFPSHFGTTIRMTFFDDLSVYQAPDDLLWTPAFNEKFRERFGRSPESLYPALWEDIGPDTGAARASLYGMRNELFAAGYPTRTGVYNILEYKKPAPWPLPLNERALTQTLQAAGGTQLSNWDKYRVPAKARHGCMLPVSRVQYTSLIQTFGRKNGEGR